MFWYFYLISVLYLQKVNTASLPYAHGIDNHQFDWEYQAFYCQDGVTYSQIISFGGSFDNPPKIIVTPEFYDSHNVFPCEFTFNAQNITTTQFNATIYCQTHQRIWRFRFRWFAFDDQRVEAFYILKNFTNLASSIFTLTHSNPNAIQGYVSALSMGYKGYVDYSLQITTLNTTHVTIQFTQVNMNILSIGIQIVLGTVEAFKLSSPITTNSLTSTSYYTSETINVSQYSNILMLPIYKAQIPTSIQIRLQLSETNTSTTKQYVVKACKLIDQIQVLDSSVDSIIHLRAWMNGTNTKVLIPLILQKMRVTRIFDMTCYSKPFFQVKFTELNLTLSSNFNQNYLISNTTKTLSIQVSYQCPVSLKVYGFFLKCVGCTSNMTIINQYCYRDINMINFYIKLKQIDTVYQNVTINVSNTGFTMNQIVMNQLSTSNYSIGQLYIVSV